MIVKLLTFLALLAASQCVNFIIKNNEIGTVTIGIRGNKGFEHLSKGGFTLDAFTEKRIDAPDDWQGIIWARTWCNWATHHCQTAGCGDQFQCNGIGPMPPVTLVEIKLRYWDGKDFYHISLINGFNLKAYMEPIDGKGIDDAYSCRRAACNYYINDVCPEEMKLWGSAGFGIGCKNPCTAFNTDQYCCRNEFSGPKRCRPSEWPVNYPAVFKKHCPDAYSHMYDNQTSTYTCIADTYRIQFG